MLDRTAAVILAAGKGTRMKSDVPKVLHEILGRPLVLFPVHLCRELGVARTVVVVGHGRDAVAAAVRAVAPDAVFAHQEEQRGTADAVRSAQAATEGLDRVLILSGDVPSLRAETVRAMVDAATARATPLVLVTFEPPDPAGYGRVVLGDYGRVQRIVEHKDAGEAERRIRTCNGGIYLVDRAFLFAEVSRVQTANSQRELYLTDIVEAASRAGTPAVAVHCADPAEVAGINDRAELAEAAARVRTARNLALQRAGVTMLDPARTLVSLDAELAADVTLGPDVTIRGRSRIGAGTVVGQGAVLGDVVLGEKVEIKPYCVIESSEVRSGAAVGPFAHLRPGTVLGEKAKVGNFVETKKAVFGKGSKASHLTYLGDCTLGDGVNVGAGTITCNYDGVNKHKTTIGDGVFVGSNTEIVAPVTIGDHALIGAGTTVTKDVPPGALVLSRVKQVNVEGWVARSGPKKQTKE